MKRQAGSNRRFLYEYWRAHQLTAALFLVFCLIFAFIFFLYHIPLEAVLYPALLCAAVGGISLLISMRRAYAWHEELLFLQNMTEELTLELPELHYPLDKDYQELIQGLLERQRSWSTKAAVRYDDMVEYYTMWVHQIKTPIAAMRLRLQNEDSELSRDLWEELQRIEQYVEMVLVYLRLNEGGNDYVIRETPLDDMLRPAVKKFATQFIRKKVSLVYEPLDISVLTDEKWLTFCIEQIISNAVKYTASGSVSIYRKEPGTLCIQDTGMGIAPEDLPRVWEKGYTGYNGRTDKQASGIGLYLCKRICDRLGHRISISSEVGKGTLVEIGLEQQELEVE